ncbi:hypothetical protein SAMN05421812_103118 [Asanoa hainanensis]|uniref:Uncharacterized protein n=1 Tax=Asanoa hainanensis TaxID=560556 RepID=A0A239JTD5_9ACTN|nr:hypothetical protein [Asanoa hainanensis]SNT09141.1 hypothetical protein SAMN05421812_103118 [Asanoa hainanensis]
MLDLLTVRMAELRDDVDKVKRVADLAESRHSRLDGIRGIRKEIRDGLLDARGLILDYRRGADAPEVEVLGDLDALLIDLDRKVDQAGVMLEQLNGSMIRLMNTDTLSVRCDAIIAELDRVEEGFRAGTLDRAAAWVAVDGLVDTTARRLFADYVDLLGGLTLRDTGLDDRVSELTDRLLDELAAPLRSVPARPAELVGGQSLGDLVMLWFPEWTIWDVPLFGHEAGLAWGHTSQLARGLLGDSPTPERRGLAADAYAAYALGPAYACAVLLLRMRPHSGDDVDRAYVILELLRATSGDGMAAAVIQEVADCWRGAVTERGADPEPGRRAELDAFVAEARGTLRNIGVFPGFDSAQWEKEAAGPHTALTEGTGSEATARGRLNAAWAARLMLTDPHDADAVRQIADAARALPWPRKTGPARDRQSGRPVQAPYGKR